MPTHALRLFTILVVSTGVLIGALKFMQHPSFIDDLLYEPRLQEPPLAYNKCQP